MKIVILQLKQVQGSIEGKLICGNCDQNYKYKLTGAVMDEEIAPVTSMSIGEFLDSVKTNILKFISHGDAQELECGNCHRILDISDLGQEEENRCNTHRCKINCHYTKLVIVGGCAPDCITCKGCKDRYRDNDGYVRCDACNEKWNGDGDGNGNCTCFQSSERRGDVSSSSSS